MRRASLVGIRGGLVLSLRFASESQLGGPSYASPWPAPGQAPERPDTAASHPHLKMRKTSVEWRLHHGNGVRHGNIGPTREVADFEYADGTPAPISIRRFAFKHHQDSFLVQLIRAGAAVERATAAGYLPRIPGVPEQRDWDPSIPLFLEDADESGKPPTSHYENARKSTNISDTSRQHIDAKYASSATKGSSSLVNAHQQESLEPITAFESYDPAAFISERSAGPPNKRRPIWSRRRWALSDEFLVTKSPQPKNTIKDE